jgi:hypothetical protein
LDSASPPAAMIDFIGSGRGLIAHGIQARLHVPCHRESES